MQIIYVEIKMKLLDVNIHEAHDRLDHIKQINSAGIGENVASIIFQRPFEDFPFYIYVHKRSLDVYEKFLLWDTGRYSSMDQVPNTRLVWQPRLKRPDPEPNTMLFKVDPSKPEEVRICWIIPPIELWQQYDEGKVAESDITKWSIDQYVHNRKLLEKKEDDDLPDERVAEIYKSLYPKMFAKEGFRLTS
jgi:hypothetical protein